MRAAIILIVVLLGAAAVAGPKGTPVSVPVGGTLHTVEHLLGCDAGAIAHVRSDPAALSGARCGSMVRALDREAKAIDPSLGSAMRKRAVADRP